MSDCRCAGDNQNGHSEYCPVWMKSRIEQLKAQLESVRRLSPYLFANDENYQIFRKALEEVGDEQM